MQCKIFIQNFVTELRPKVKDHHRADKMALWSKLIPELLTNAINDKVTANVDVEGDLMILPSGGFRPIIPFPLPTDNTKSYPSENIPPARVFNPPTTDSYVFFPERSLTPVLPPSFSRVMNLWKHF